MKHIILYFYSLLFLKKIITDKIISSVCYLYDRLIWEGTSFIAIPFVEADYC